MATDWACIEMLLSGCHRPVPIPILSMKTAGREPDDVSGTRCGWIPGNLMIKVSLGLKMVIPRARGVTEITWLVQG